MEHKKSKLKPDNDENPVVADAVERMLSEVLDRLRRNLSEMNIERLRSDKVVAEDEDLPSPMVIYDPRRRKCLALDFYYERKNFPQEWGELLEYYFFDRRRLRLQILMEKTLDREIRRRPPFEFENGVCPLGWSPVAKALLVAKYRLLDGYLDVSNSLAFTICAIENSSRDTKTFFRAGCASFSTSFSNFVGLVSLLRLQHAPREGYGHTEARLQQRLQDMANQPVSTVLKEQAAKTLSYINILLCRVEPPWIYMLNVPSRAHPLTVSQFLEDEDDYKLMLFVMQPGWGPESCIIGQSSEMKQLFLTGLVCFLEDKRDEELLQFGANPPKPRFPTKQLRKRRTTGWTYLPFIQRWVKDYFEGLDQLDIEKVRKEVGTSCSRGVGVWGFPEPKEGHQ